MNNWFKEHLSSPIINYLGRQKCNRYFPQPPILIGGCGRSGTTLLLAILSAHPDIFAIPHETDAFTDWTAKDHKGFPVRIDRFHRAILQASVHTAHKRWCEKRPANVHHIEDILGYFGPKAKFIHIVRDPRAVCTSVHPLDPHQYWIPIDRYIKDVNAGIRHENHPQVYTLRYEDLVLAPGKEIAALSEFLELSPFNQTDNWFEHATVRTNKAWSGSLKNIQHDSLHKWKNPEHSERVKTINSNESIRKLMAHFNYSIK
ncbi:MAG: sulfotransferase [Cyclobacteriaceae bacterium]